MTLNQCINRIKLICQAHLQVRTFVFGVTSDMFNEKTTRYPAALLQDTNGSLETKGKEWQMTFKLFLVDLVNVSTEAKANEQDVESDMLEIAKDLVAEMNSSNYTDWGVGLSTPVILVREQFNDLVAGVSIDVTIRTPWTQDTCAVPSEALPGMINNDDMKLVYDKIYTSNGSEGSTLTPAMIPEVTGKKVLFVTRNQSPIFKVSNSPVSDEYTWNDTNMVLGTPVNPEGGERFLILYRNY